jgi:hypothetical protein
MGGKTLSNCLTHHQGRDLFALAPLTPCQSGLRHPDIAVITASCVPQGPARTDASEPKRSVDGQRQTRPCLNFHRLSLLLLAFLGVALTPVALADGPGRIYTKPLAADTGLITGQVTGAILTHAIAVERDRTRVYLGTLDPVGTGFRFPNLPVGRFDLVLVTRDMRVIEGLGLGGAADLPTERARHLTEDVAKADSFFNRRVPHRTGLDGEVALVFTERIRDGRILRGSGEPIDAGLRRLEIIELREASDEWQMVRTRHIYREETPNIKGIPFLSHLHLPALGGWRVAATPRDLGTINLTKNQRQK